MGVDPGTDDVKYVGITGREPEIRWNEHLNSQTERATLDYQVFDSGYTKLEARIVEQFLINQYGLNYLYNKINSIAPRYWKLFNL